MIGSDELLRYPIVDIRPELPRMPSLHWAQRDLSDIVGIVVHHTAGDRSPVAEAHGHIRRGWPSLGYHLWIEPSGQVALCNSLEHVVFAQGGGRPPLPFSQPNNHYVSIVLRGDFTSRDPMSEAELALRWVVALLRDLLSLEPDALFVHNELKPTLCPGKVAEIVEGMLSGLPNKRNHLPRTVSEVQRILVGLGHDLGKTGRDGNGIDGDFGPKTRRALIEVTGQSNLSARAAYALAEIHAEYVSQNPPRV